MFMAGKLGKVLVIEDDESIRVSSAEVLAHSGFEVVVAEDGIAGWESVLTQGPDIVLCDLRMPGLDGLGVLGAIKGDPDLKNTPVIFTSAKASQAEIEQGLNAGAAGYLVKPFSRKQLLECLSEALRGRSAG
jgi:CheY-like chemotaxis protein